MPSLVILLYPRFNVSKFLLFFWKSKNSLNPGTRNTQIYMLKDMRHYQSQIDLNRLQILSKYQNKQHDKSLVQFSPDNISKTG